MAELIMVATDGILLRMLEVNDEDSTTPCEECGRPMYSHPKLAKMDDDWCIDCNDIVGCKDMSELEISQWCMAQMLKGKAIGVVRRRDDE